MNDYAAMEKLAALPLLPLTPKQRGMLGEARVGASFQAQKEAQGISQAPDFQTATPQSLYFPSKLYSNGTDSLSIWAAQVTAEVASLAARTHNHVCRPDVCHKGRIGKMGFCRMYYWHWARFMDEKGALRATRNHGLELVPRWSGHGVPPLCGSPPSLGLPA